jgi:hypothetical protein
MKLTRTHQIILFMFCLLPVQFSPCCAQGIETKVVAARTSDPIVSIDWPEFISRHDLVWDQLPQNWNAGSFEGNGMLGSVVYQADTNAICWQIGHSEVTQRQPEANGRMPIGRLFLNTVGTIQSGTMRLDLWNARTVIHVVTDKGTLSVSSLIHSEEMVQAVTLRTTGEESGASFAFKPGVALKKRYRHPWGAHMEGVSGVRHPYGDGEIWVTDRGTGGEYATVWKEFSLPQSQRLVLLTVVDSYPEKEAVADAKEIIESVGAQDWDVLESRHRAWWHDYYPASFITVPDARIETFYWVQIYKLACATRGDRAVASTLGPWFRKTIWPRTWLNYNTQTFYSPFAGANRTELSGSLFLFLKQNEDNMRRHAQHFFNTEDGLSCPPSAPHEGVWKQGNGRYDNPGDIAWLLYVCWQHYRHTMDHSLVVDGDKYGMLYDYLRKVGNVYLKTISKGEDGKYHLPVWMSPEYKRAANNNYNLSGCRFVFRTLLELSARYKIDDPLIPEWEDRLAHLVDYPTDTNGYMVGAGVPFGNAHRHWSHLQMVFPYYQVDLDDPAVRHLAVTSINHWTDAEPTKSFYGWSAAAASSLHSATGNGNEALKWLLRHHNEDRFVMPNTMYLEGYPVIESATIAARSLQDMLLQSHSGVIRVFPAIPDAWKRCGFHDMRTEGAFLVSALRANGKTQWVRIKSLAGEPCVVRVDSDATPQITGNRAFRLTPKGRHTWAIDLQKDEEIVLSQEGQNRYVLSPLQSPNSEWNYYGINRNGKTEAEYQSIIKKAVLKREETHGLQSPVSQGSSQL